MPTIKIEVAPARLRGLSLFNFTYSPTTIHVVSGAKVDFQLVGSLPAGILLHVIFMQGGPFSDPNFQVPFAGEAIVSAPGIYHYGAILTDTKGGIVAYDVHCPSIIVH